jgi:hypothetical protein
MSRINRSLLLSALTCTAIAALSPARAGDTHVKLSGAEETPAVATSATGTATISVGADRKVSGVVKTTGVDGTAAHIHSGGPGEKGPPVITLDKGANGDWTVPAGAVLTDEQYAAYQAGKLYINIHSTANKGGEIRGQIKP